MRTLTALRSSFRPLLVLALAVALPAAFTPAVAAADPGHDTNDIVKVGSDVRIAAGETVDSVTVFGGDAVIAGTVRRSVVAVGGDIRLRDGAQVGTEMAAGDTTVLAIGGKTTVAPGATVTGTTGAWEDISSGEAVIAASIALVGVVIAGVAFAALVLLVLAAGVVFVAAFATLIVWLIYRERRKDAAAATWMTGGTNDIPVPVQPPSFTAGAAPTAMT